jgi:hypothetical protein
MQMEAKNGSNQRTTIGQNKEIGQPGSCPNPCTPLLVFLVIFLDFTLDKQRPLAVIYIHAERYKNHGFSNLQGL